MLKFLIKSGARAGVEGIIDGVYKYATRNAKIKIIKNPEMIPFLLNFFGTNIREKDQASFYAILNKIHEEDIAIVARHISRAEAIKILIILEGSWQHKEFLKKFNSLHKPFDPEFINRIISIKKWLEAGMFEIIANPPQEDNIERITDFGEEFSKAYHAIEMLGSEKSYDVLKKAIEEYAEIERAKKMSLEIPKIRSRAAIIANKVLIDILPKLQDIAYAHVELFKKESESRKFKQVFSSGQHTFSFMIHEFLMPLSDDLSQQEKEVVKKLIFTFFRNQAVKVNLLLALKRKSTDYVKKLREEIEIKLLQNGDFSDAKLQEQLDKEIAKNDKLLKYALENSIDVWKMRFADGSTPLMQAAASGDVATMQLLIEKAAPAAIIDDVDNNDLTVFMHALKHCEEGAIDFLIGRGYELKITDGKGLMALLKIINKDNIHIIIRALREFQINLNHFYCAKDFIEILKIKNDLAIKFLIKNLDWSRHINALDDEGSNPIMLAASSASPEVFDFLKEFGSGIGIINKKSETPLIKAVKSENYEVIKIIFDILYQKYQHGSSLDVFMSSEFMVRKDDISWDVDHDLSSEVFVDNNKFVPSITESKITTSDTKAMSVAEYLNICDEDGRNAFMKACYSRNLRMVEIFLQFFKKIGFEINAVSGVGRNALNDAAIKGHFEIVQKLLEYGADPHVKVGAYKDQTAFDVACRTKNFVTAILLAKAMSMSSEVIEELQVKLSAAAKITKPIETIAEELVATPITNPVAERESVSRVPLNSFNKFSERDHLANQHVHFLLRKVFRNICGLSEEVYRKKLDNKEIDFAIIAAEGEAINPTYDAIMNFINSPDALNGTIILCRAGRVVNRGTYQEVMGDTHFTSLNLVKNFREDGSISVTIENMDSVLDSILPDLQKTFTKARDDLIARGGNLEYRVRACERQEYDYDCGYHAIRNAVIARSDVERNVELTKDIKSFKEYCKPLLQRKFNATDVVAAAKPGDKKRTRPSRWDQGPAEPQPAEPQPRKKPSRWGPPLEPLSSLSHVTAQGAMQSAPNVVVAAAKLSDKKRTRISRWD